MMNVFFWAFLIWYFFIFSQRTPSCVSNLTGMTVRPKLGWAGLQATVLHQKSFKGHFLVFTSLHFMVLAGLSRKKSPTPNNLSCRDRSSCIYHAETQVNVFMSKLWWNLTVKLMIFLCMKNILLVKLNYFISKPHTHFNLLRSSTTSLFWFLWTKRG